MRLCHPLALILFGLVAKVKISATHLVPTSRCHNAESSPHHLDRGRGGAQSLPNGSRSNSSSLVELRKQIPPLTEKFIENTLYSKANQPESYRQAEWMGFLGGWLLVSLPVPSPILVSVLVLNTLILLGSKWDDTIKNNYMFGFSHGVLVLVVLLRELEAKLTTSTNSITNNTPPGGGGSGISPRVAMMGLNLATSFLFGRAGSSVIAKRLMNTAAGTTLLYIIIHYF